MITYYIIKERNGQQMIASGHVVRYTYNVNAAKHFTSQWSAEQWLKKVPDSELFTIVKIERY